MSRATLEAAIPSGVPILLHTSAVLAYLDGNEAASPAAALVFDELVASGRNPATLAAVTVTETLVRPFAAGPAAVGIAEAFLGHFPNLAVAAATYATAREAARLRAATNLRTPDALVIATAMVEGIGVIVANDARWNSAITKAAPHLALCHLDAHLPL